MIDEFDILKCGGCHAINWKIISYMNRVQFQCDECGNIYRPLKVHLYLKDGFEVIKKKVKK